MPKAYIRAARRQETAQGREEEEKAELLGRRTFPPQSLFIIQNLSNSMNTKGSLFASLSLLLLLCFQHARAHPIDILSPAKELASMEALLERLDEKISLMEELQDNAILEDPEVQKGSLAEFPTESFDQQPQPRVESSPYFSDLLKRMRGLQAPKSMRESGCFGRRLDRIGSVSGMGCKGARRN